MTKVRFMSRQWARENKRNMVIFGAVAWGIPMWLIEIWIAWDFLHTLLWIVFLGFSALVVGLLWGWAMWYATELIQRNNRNSNEAESPKQ